MRIRIFCVALGIACSSASAETLEERESIAERTKQLKAKADAVAKECGGKLAVTVDWKSFVPHFHDTLKDEDGNEDIMERCNKPTTLQATNCAVSPCEVVLDGISQVCSNTYGDVGKTAVAHGITAVTCTFDASVAKHPAVTIPLTLTGSTLAARYNWRAKDTQSTMSYLVDNLPAHPTIGPAQTVMERFKINERDAELQTAAQRAADACGAKLDVSVDWPSFIPHFHDVLKQQDDPCSNPSAAQATTCAESACEQAMGAIDGICRTSEGKKSIAKQLKSVRCTWDGTLPDRKLGYSLKGGVLTIKYHFRVANVDEQTTEFLNKAL